MSEPTTRTVYVPTLISNVEQAEKLPAGTVAIENDDGQMAYIRSDHYPTWYATTDCNAWVDNAEMVGRTALVPVTATVEWGRADEPGGTPNEYPEDNFGVYGRLEDARADAAEHEQNVVTRFTTPWTPGEDA